MNTVTAGPASKSRKLWAIVEENLPRIMTTSVERRYWAEATGYAYVEQLAFKEDVESIKMSLEGNYFATCSLAAVFQRPFVFTPPSFIRRYKIDERYSDQSVTLL